MAQALEVTLSTMKLRLALGVALLFAVLGSVTTHAGFHASDDIEDLYVDNARQQAIVVWSDNWQETILAPRWQINHEDKEALGVKGTLATELKKLCWVLPVPDKIASHAMVESAVLTDLATFTEVSERVPMAGNKDDVIKEQAESGDTYTRKDLDTYTVESVEGKGKDARKNLEKKLKAAGVGPPSDTALDWYEDNDWTFVVVTLTADDGVPLVGDFKPLRVGFKTDRPVFPIKIMDKQGAFDLDLWVVIQNELDLTKSKRFGIQTCEQRDEFYSQKNRKTAFGDLPESLREALRESENLKAIKFGEVYCYRFEGRDYEYKTDVGGLQSDIRLAFASDLAPTPPKKEPEKKPDDSDTKDASDKSTDKPKDEPKK